MDITPMAIINVNMQSTPVIDQCWLLINTSMVVGKSLQSMEIKIDKLNKNIGQYKKDCSLKDKTIIGLQNQIRIY